MIKPLKPHWILLFSILVLIQLPVIAQSKKKQILSLNVTIDSLENALVQSKGKIISLEQQMNDHDAKNEMEINKLKGELQELRGELQELQTQLQQTQEAKKVLESKFNVKMEEHSKEKSNLNNTIEQLRKKNDILQIALDETNNQLAQLQKKTIEKNEKFLRVLSDSARNATLISELIPENCIVQASEIYDINGDFIDDFVVIYQDTNGFQTFMGGDLFNSPIIIEVYFFNRVTKTLENRIHCVELFSSWGTPWDEDIGIKFISKNEGINLEFWHYGMGSSHETETVIFRYNAESEDFKLSLIDHSSMSRIGDHPITQWFLADFEKKIIEDYNKPKKKINFKAPTLSEWPNGNWKLLGWKNE